MRKNISAPQRGKFVLSLPIFLSLILMGCVAAPSLYPLYDKSVLTTGDKSAAVTDDRLIGRWEMVDPDQTTRKQDCCWTVEKDGDGYKTVLPDPDNNVELVTTIHLVKVGDAVFLDGEGANLTYTRTTQLSAPFLAAHAIGRIWIEKDALRIEMLSDDWLRDSAKNGAPALSFVEPDKQLVITANTAQLQAFVRQYANDTKAFSDELKLVRHK